MSHEGSDGSGLGQRVTREGYAWSAVGENVAHGHRSASHVMTDWLDSPGHCANIMHPAFTEFGAGEVNHYWTQVFARPR